MGGIVVVGNILDGLKKEDNRLGVLRPELQDGLLDEWEGSEAVRLRKRYVVAVVVETGCAGLLDGQGKGLAAFGMLVLSCASLHCLCAGKAIQKVGGKKDCGWDGCALVLTQYRYCIVPVDWSSLLKNKPGSENERKVKDRLFSRSNRQSYPA